MIPQVVTSETVAMISPNGMSLPQTDKPQPFHQWQDSLKKHLKAEIKVMAAIQIMCAVMVLSLGIILASVPSNLHFTSVFSVLLKSGYPFIGALFFIVSGILSIVTETKSTKILVDSSLTLNILSVSFAFMGIIIISVSLAGLHPASEQCLQSKELRPTEYHYYQFLDRNECFAAKSVLAGVFSLMLISTMLELGLAVLTAMLWWKQSHSNIPGNVMFLPHSSNNDSNMESKVLCNPSYEEQLVC
ncbi:membrane-spanning 4-domains subfamily A member 6B [Mus musculus]|uniref:Membrane-spanning 4-domains subfamily A member 6B n=1 Tax=Mus musculus TaxID=10090 RepID=M4A6B_MOUSE|nr:membrane-spanning 4-domains subfamily A member 6B [Mus musculus]Q99N09.1 RecName: Full=Membrane-spanning 4-domains subfamily A member 6B [Mus musculus]AAH27425.1 Membrane-spanning 4-domains, subfamily A, member 6B [Mus musculus]AAK37418.1 MS4A6B protein [Mus musculus]|eukprot:NP_081485.2 membrane-spanning 4-domains subfamily A member 6B [Mus musculus]